MTTDSKPRSTSGPDVAVLVGDPPLLDDSAVRRLVLDALEALSAPARIELSIHFVDPAEIARLNTQALGGTGPTDVISLPLEQLTPGRWPQVGPDDPPIALGDVFIAPEIVRARAIDHGFDPTEETALMVVHGVLHLVGHDHVADAEADAMEAIESAILTAHGYGRR